MFRKFYHNHKEWFALFTSAFAGTLLGIVITFGVGGYVEDLDNKKMAYKFLVTSIDDIDEHLETMEDDIPSMQEIDSLLKKVLTYCPDHIEDIPDSLANKLMDTLFTRYANLKVSKTNSYTSQLLMKNMESLKVFDDLSILSDVSEIIERTDHLDNTKLQVDGIIERLIEKYMHMCSVLSGKSKVELSKLLQDPETSNLIFIHNTFTKVFFFTYEIYAKEIHSIVNDLGIKTTDLETTISDRGIFIDTTYHSEI